VAIDELRAALVLFAAFAAAGDFTRAEENANDAFLSAAGSRDVDLARA
jgi:hypothetical protein